MSIYALYLNAGGRELHFTRPASEGRGAPIESLCLFCIEKSRCYTAVQALLRDDGARPAYNSGVESKGEDEERNKVCYAPAGRSRVRHA